MGNPECCYRQLVLFSGMETFVRAVNVTLAAVFSTPNACIVELSTIVYWRCGVLHRHWQVIHLLAETVFVDMSARQLFGRLQDCIIRFSFPLQRFLLKNCLQGSKLLSVILSQLDHSKGIFLKCSSNRGSRHTVLGVFQLQIDEEILVPMSHFCPYLLATEHLFKNEFLNERVVCYRSTLFPYAIIDSLSRTRWRAKPQMMTQRVFNRQLGLSKTKVIEDSRHRSTIEA